MESSAEELLALARPEARVTVLGPTAGMLPDAFLARAADVLGSVRITQPDAFLDLLAEGGSAPPFLGRSAEKIVLAKKALKKDRHPVGLQPTDLIRGGGRDPLFRQLAS